MSWDSFKTKADMTDKYSLTWSSQGAGGAGKTHLLLTAPDPIWIAVFNDPGGVESLVKQHKEFRKKDIRWTDYTFNPGKLVEGERSRAAEEELARFLADYQTALKHASTVGWDKEDLVWELLRYARLGAVSERPSKYYELNLEYRGWFADAAEAGVNLGVIRGMKEVWGTTADNKPQSTGREKPRGQKEVNEMVQIVLHHFWNEDEREFQVRLGGQDGDEPKCRVGDASELIGQVHSGLDFDTLVALIYPEVEDPAVWRRAA